MSTTSPHPALAALKKACATLLAYPFHFLLLQIPEVSVDFLRVIMEPDKEQRIWLVVLVLFPYFCIMSFLSTALTFAAVETAEGKKPKLKKSWAIVIAKLPTLIPVSLLVGVLYLLGLLALILPHIYFFAIYMFVPLLIVSEPKSPWSAYMYRSKKLAKPYLWQTLTAALLMFFVTLAFELDVKSFTEGFVPTEFVYVVKLLLMAVVGSLFSLWISYYFVHLKAIRSA